MYSTGEFRCEGDTGRNDSCLGENDRNEFFKQSMYDNVDTGDNDRGVGVTRSSIL